LRKSHANNWPLTIRCRYQPWKFAGLKASNSGAVTNTHVISHSNRNVGNILLHKATKRRQTEGSSTPRMQLCIEPLLSKFPLSRYLYPAAGGVFFGCIRPARYNEGFISNALGSSAWLNKTLPRA
jgi:hypothetical protein